jgi:inner membrane protein
MDSLSQIALGSALGVAVMGRRTTVWKAALWGGIAGTLPDLDAFINHGDPVRNMTFHRAESHALFYLTLAAPLLAAGVAKLHGEWHQVRYWWLALWLALFTHPLLDWTTIYGTQLALPFTDTPYGLGSMFIIDPLYTLPLLIGLIVTLSLRSARGLRWNRMGLVISVLYLGWSVVAQAYVEAIAQNSLRKAKIESTQWFVTPTPFNTVAWRVVAMTPTGYVEGFYSLLDDEPHIDFDAFTSEVSLRDPLQDGWAFQRMAWFTKGFYALVERDGRAVITDLRMGQEPNYVFSFAIAQHGSPWSEIQPMSVGGRNSMDLERSLAWLWQRIKGHRIPPPR